MKIDLYSKGDPEDPDTWSRTPYEIVTELRSRNLLAETYDVEPSRFDRLAQVPYLRIDRNGIYSIREHHPRYRRRIRKHTLALEEERSPDAIISVGDFAEFKNAPYHIYQDLDVETLIQWRRSGRSTHSFDQFSLDLLQRRKEIQLDIYRSAESILVASEWVAQQVRSYINEPEKVHAVGLGHRYSISKISETVVQQRYDNPCILFVGKDGTRKGLDILIRAYQNARKSLSHSKLTIVTDIDKLSEADKDICKKSEYINLFENVSLDQLQELYRTHSVFVMPSRFEAWGKVFFEAMSFGLPVIGANRCAMPEFIRDGVNGYTVQPDIVELCDALQRVFNSYNSYKKLSSNALSVADQYTWPTIINKIIKQIKI